MRGRCYSQKAGLREQCQRMMEDGGDVELGLGHGENQTGGDADSGAHSDACADGDGHQAGLRWRCWLIGFAGCVIAGLGKRNGDAVSPTFGKLGNLISGEKDRVGALPPILSTSQRSAHSGSARNAIVQHTQYST